MRLRYVRVRAAWVYHSAFTTQTAELTPPRRCRTREEHQWLPSRRSWNIGEDKGSLRSKCASSILLMRGFMCLVSIYTSKNRAVAFQAFRVWFESQSEGCRREECKNDLAASQNGQGF